MYFTKSIEVYCVLGLSCLGPVLWWRYDNMYVYKTLHKLVKEESNEMSKGDIFLRSSIHQETCKTVCIAVDKEIEGHMDICAV